MHVLEELPQAGRIWAVRDLECYMGIKVDDIRFKVCLVITIHKYLHSQASSSGRHVRSQQGARETDYVSSYRCYTRSPRRTCWPVGTKTWSNRLRKAYESDAGNLLIHNLADTRIHAKAAGPEKAMMSATDLQYLLVPILLFCLFPRLGFPNGFAIPRAKEAYTNRSNAGIELVSDFQKG